MSQRSRSAVRIGALAVSLLGCFATAQEDTRPVGHLTFNRRGDVDELLVLGLHFEHEGFEAMADRALIALDASVTARSARGSMGGSSGLPTRGSTLPPSRRAWSSEAMRARLLSFLSSTGRTEDLGLEADFDLSAVRGIYLDGNVRLLRDGLVWLEASRFWFDAASDRIVLTDATLRLMTEQGSQSLAVTVRGPRLVRQGKRIVGDGVSVTTCPAGEPQFEVASGYIEIIERPGQFEIRSRDNDLKFFGSSWIPLPDQSWLTGEQDNLLIKSVAAGFSNREGIRTRVVLGSSFNETGGAIHEAITGRSADEFRGDWRLGLGWIEKRGFPLDGDLEYGAPGVYSGRTRGFSLDDEGRNIREIRRDFGGNLIENSNRSLFSTENRIHLSETTTLDLSAFEASDPAVYSEFHRAQYWESERPETSAHLRHADENRILTVTGRWNLTEFSYDDGRTLAERFIEEQPNVTFDWFSIPVLELSDDVPLLVTSSTGVAQLRSNFDDQVVDPQSDETFRVDQRLGLTAPFGVGVVQVRPFVEGRFTHYSDSPTDDSVDRLAFTGGVDLATRLAKSWRWTSDRGDREAVRHVLNPILRFEDAFRVTDDPNELHQFDAVDTVAERGNVRIGLLQRLQHARTTEDGDVMAPQNVAWLDLAQNINPDPDADEDSLGLFEFELRVRPLSFAEGAPDLRFLTEGEVDWESGELRTLNNYLQWRTYGVTWFGEYRTDQTEDGQIGYGARVPIRRRWVVSGYNQYDLGLGENIRYSANLIRNDLNWQLRFGVLYNNVVDDTTFRVDFRPRFGGLFRTARPRQFGAQDVSIIDPTVY